MIDSKFPGKLMSDGLHHLLSEIIQKDLPYMNGLWKHEEEARVLLYHAITRARKSVSVTYPTNYDSGRRTKLSRYVVLYRKVTMTLGTDIP